MIRLNKSCLPTKEAKTHMTPQFLRAYPPAESIPGSAYWFPFRRDKVLVEVHEHTLTPIQGGEEIRNLLQPARVLNLGALAGKACLTCEVAADFTPPQNWQAMELRALYGRLDNQNSALAGYASQLLLWERTIRYCPSCGHITEPLAGTWGKHCPNCGYEHYPPVTPAVLVLVHDDKRMLLTHKKGWGKRYSCIAGFVEPGESLEECVQREVYEEVGLEVSDIEYVGSQPWPYPHQLMVGFHARFSGGTLQPDGEELDDAQWFSLDALPELPPPVSLAHHIIVGWINAHRSTSG
jgi:NAD+ diphosphatase